MLETPTEEKIAEPLSKERVVRLVLEVELAHVVDVSRKFYGKASA
jgi:hypothetical protein